MSGRSKAEPGVERTRTGERGRAPSTERGVLRWSVESGVLPALLGGGTLVGSARAFRSGDRERGVGEFVLAAVLLAIAYDQRRAGGLLGAP